MLHVARDASQQNVSANGRYGSIASFWSSTDYFRSSPGNGHRQGRSPCLKAAKQKKLALGETFCEWKEQRRRRVVHSNATCTGKLRKRIIMTRTLTNLALKSLFGVITGMTIFTHQAISAPIAGPKGLLVAPLDNSQFVQVRAARSGYRGGSVHRGSRRSSPENHRLSRRSGGSTGGSCRWRPVLWRFLRSLLWKLRGRQLLSWRSLPWRRRRQGRSRRQTWRCCPRRISRSPCWAPSGRRTPALIRGCRWGIHYDGKAQY